MADIHLAEKIRSVKSIEEMDGLVEYLDTPGPIGGDVRSMINLRRIELQLAAQKVRK